MPHPEPALDGLTRLLSEKETLFGAICRDATQIDLELMGQSGYDIIWLDAEHSSQSLNEMLRLSRTIGHLGMVPMLRVSELSRTQIQTALDGGIQILTLPNVTTRRQVEEFASLGKYPPIGRRGVSTTSAGSNYNLSERHFDTLRAVNDATHLMPMIENEEGYQNMDDILEVPDCDMITVGPLDWATDVGLQDEEARLYLTPRIEHVITAGIAKNKLVATVVLGDPETLRRHSELGVRILFVGEDIPMKRGAYDRAITESRAAL